MTRQFQEDDFLWLVGSVCRLHGVPFDASLLAEQYPPPCTAEHLRRALDDLGLAAGDIRLDTRALKTLTPPCVAFLKRAPTPDSEATPLDPALVRGVLIVQADAERLMLFHPGSETPETLSRAEFIERYEAAALKIERKPTSDGELADPADRLAGRPLFGLRWFIPELMKHKRIWRDVLLASLAIQLLGLGLPIFTQIVIENEP